MDKDKIDEIKREFVDLIKKHKATISFVCDEISDLAGVYEPQIVITVENGRNDVKILVSNDYCLDHSGL